MPRPHSDYTFRPEPAAFRPEMITFRLKPAAFHPGLAAFRPEVTTFRLKMARFRLKTIKIRGKMATWKAAAMQKGKEWQQPRRETTMEGEGAAAQLEANYGKRGEG